RAQTEEQGLSHLIDVVDGSFEDLTFDDKYFAIIWSQDAMRHSGERIRVLEEATRVLKPKGEFVFTDPMASDSCEKSKLQPTLDRLHLETLGSPNFYRRDLGKLRSSVELEYHTPQLPTHYARVLDVRTERENYVVAIPSAA